MRTKSVWLHSPFGNPKKRLFSVSENEISLGDSVLATTEVIECKRRYPNAFYKVFNVIVSIGLFVWTFYEMFSLLFRLQVVILVELSPELDAVRTREKMQDLLQTLHLRASTTDGQQFRIFLFLYVFTILYGLIFSNLLFRPHVVITSSTGEVFRAPYGFARPRKFVKTLGAARKVARKNRKRLRKGRNV